MMQKGVFAQNKSDGDETLGTESCWAGDFVIETAARKGVGCAYGQSCLAGKDGACEGACMLRFRCREPHHVDWCGVI